MDILLVRHGHSLGNENPAVYQSVADRAIPLSERGHRQAAAAGSFLRDYITAQRTAARAVGGGRFEKIRLWSSTYERARQTSAAIMAACGGLIDSQREHINLIEQQFGLFDGLSEAELIERFPVEHAHYQKCMDHDGRFYAKMPLGESRFDVAVRVHQAFGTFHRDAERSGIDTIVVVGHGVGHRAFAMQWLHHPPEWFDSEPNPENCSVRHIAGSEDLHYVYAGGGR